MDDRTGEIYDRNPGESFKHFSKRVGVPTKNLIELQNRPPEKCPKCRGLGYKPRGMGSKKFIPCECTNPVLP